MSLVLAIDPGTHETGIVTMYESGVLSSALCVSGTRGLKCPDAVIDMAARLKEILRALILTTDPPDVICIERQDWYGGKDRSTPKDMIAVAQVTGAALASSIGYGTLPKNVYFPTPREWKAGAKKDATRLLVRSEVSNVDFWLSGVPASKHEHIYDACGLALWASKKAALEEKIRRAERPRSSTSRRRDPR
jgi:Holliday junction resolvasome RuvABC endonuclease subunit